MPRLSQSQKKINHHLYQLMRELFYPAFLGALLFEFTKHALEHGKPGEPRVDMPALYYWAALWFIAYFAVGFLALSETKGEKGVFGPLAFFANLLEIAVILIVCSSLALLPGVKEHFPEGTNVINKIFYGGIYLSWILIPITAALSNYCSGRRVHGLLSLCAMGVGAIGFWFFDSPPPGNSNALIDCLTAMSLLLFWYFCIVFQDLKFDRYVEYLEFSREKPLTLSQIGWAAPAPVIIVALLIWKIVIVSKG